MAKGVERPQGRSAGLDASTFEANNGIEQYEILEDLPNRRYIVTKGEFTIGIPAENVIRVQYYSYADAIGDSQELVTEKGDVPGEMTVTLQPKRGPGRPRKDSIV